MRSITRGRAFALTVLLLAAACAAPGPPPRGVIEPPHEHAIEADASDLPTPWTGLEANDAPGSFRFLVVTDRTGEHRPGVFEQAIPKINLLQPAFVVSVGDLIEGYTEDPDELAAQWDEMEGFVSRLEMPFFYAAGNHDFSNSVMAEEWRRRFGPSYYHFEYQGVFFLVLNSELFSSVSSPGQPVPGPDTQAEQMAYVERVLGEHADARWTFVIVHQPLWDRSEIHSDWLDVEALLGDRPYTVFAGHFHQYTAQRRHDRRYLTLATTGGRSRMRGIDFGEFDHVALVSVDAGDPVLANLMLDGIHDADVRSEATRTLVGQLEAAVTVDPVFEDGLAFRGGQVGFRIENPTADPVRVQGAFSAGRDLRPEPEIAELVLAPGASEHVVVDLVARESVPFETIAPASARFTLTGTKSDGGTVAVERSAWLLPQHRFFAQRAESAPAIDGNLDDWSVLPFTVEGRESQGAPDAARFRFGVLEDEAGLYLGVDVTDPTPFSSPDRIAREQDAVTVMLDARPDPQRSANEGFFRAVGSGALKEMLLASLLPVEPPDDPIFTAFLPALPDAVQRASRRTASGYSAELFVPAAYLDARAGGPWRALRLNVSVLDFAADGHTSVTHWWRPSRFGFAGAPLPGAGTFDRIGAD